MGSESNFAIIEGMSLSQLESIVVVAQEQHLGRAARRLCVSQPPLTRRIRKLEAELGIEIFERSPKGMFLRPEGRAVVQQARRVLEQVRRLRLLSDALVESAEGCEGLAWATQGPSRQALETASSCKGEH